MTFEKHRDDFCKMQLCSRKSGKVVSSLLTLWHKTKKLCRKVVNPPKVLVLWSLKTGMRPNPREILLHAAFQTLVEFVEEDAAHIMQFCTYRARGRCLCDGLEYLEAEEHPLRWQQHVIHLYKWWKIEYPQRKEPKTIEEEQQQIMEEQRMFNLLVSIRDDLWT